MKHKHENYDIGNQKNKDLNIYHRVEDPENFAETRQTAVKTVELNIRQSVYECRVHSNRHHNHWMTELPTPARVGVLSTLPQQWMIYQQLTINWSTCGASLSHWCDWVASSMLSRKMVARTSRGGDGSRILTTSWYTCPAFTSCGATTK